MKTSEIKHLLFMPLDLKRPPDIDLNYLDNLPESSFRNDLYRNCRHLPIHYINSDKEWVFTNHYPKLNEWLEETVWPLTGLTRVVIICTYPGETNPPHIDCSPEMFPTLNHKIRYVYRGNVDDLVFMGKDEGRGVPNINSPFIMNGSWPHWMKNNHSEIKYTLAVGSPWEADIEDPKYIKLLEHSYDFAQNDEYYVSDYGLELPDNYEDFYEDKYR
jgi:hypothetical protein